MEESKDKNAETDSENVSVGGNENGEKKEEEKDDSKHKLRFSHVNDQGYDVFNITESGSVTKTIIKKREDGGFPHILGRIWINIKGETKDGSIIFEDSLFEEIDFVLGQAQHCRGIEMALATMRIGEHAVIEINDTEYSYPETKRPSKCPKDKTKENEHLWPLKFTVILIDSMPKQKMSHEMTFMQQFEHANILKMKGNDRYKKKRYETAIKLYKKSLQCLEAMNDNNIEALNKNEDLKPVSKDSIDSAKLNVYSNLAICYLRSKEWGLGVESATNALKLDNKSLKALLRRGICYREQTNYDKAQSDFETYLSLLDPNDNENIKVGKKQIKILNKMRKHANQQIQNQFGGFLDNKKGFQLYQDKSDTPSHDTNDDLCKDDSWLDMVTTPCVSAMHAIYDLALSCCGKKKRA